MENFIHKSCLLAIFLFSQISLAGEKDWSDLSDVFDLKWRSKLGGYTRPVVADSKVLFMDERILYALETNSGRAIWICKIDRHSLPPPPAVSREAISPDVVCLATKSKLYGLDVNTGDELWAFHTNTLILVSPRVWDNTVFISSGDINSPGTLYALDLHTGQEKWRFKAESGIKTAPVVHRKTVYFGCWNGEVFGLDIKTGKRRWYYNARRSIHALTITKESVICLASGDLRGIDLNTNRVVWRFDTYGQQIEYLITRDNVLYFARDSGGAEPMYSLNAFDLENQKILWTHFAWLTTMTYPAFYLGNIYLGVGQQFHILDAFSGELKHKIRERLLSPPTIESGTIYFCGGEGYLYAMKIK